MNDRKIEDLYFEADAAIQDVEALSELLHRADRCCWH